ncbi:hypothetical protein [Dactylococcopsis salina]|uniref:Glycosyltransferase RgtA/B/C/D-like domain-containing protein n=1 Tax=Dactylococcopsis salina (strain PCC 8305) TaxID=13035 RepID=K9Z151_DACS8|nr:hypothetical protein [Dactylococcopsis salina]AFZ52093.1 hypothetical protein Dacsa_3613 [Dactylococcopsis salina PCC 8305]
MFTKVDVCYRWLHHFFTARSFTYFWFALSLTVVLIYSLLGLQEAFISDYFVQDDARQHVFWMRRFLDPSLFPNDLIANYFQTVAPWGYRFVYWLPAQLGIDPLLLNKFIPVFLNLLTAFFCFSVVLEILPIPFAAFSGTILLAQSLGLLSQAIVSGTARSFLYPLFLAFILFLLQKRLFSLLATIALQGLFYPQLLLITSVTLFIDLFTIKRGKLKLTSEQKNRYISILGLIVATIVILPFALNSNEFSPVITREQAMQLPEFFPQGRSEFFQDDDGSFSWWKGRSGLGLASALTPVTNILAFFIPFLMLFPRAFPFTQKLSRNLILFPQILLASGVMFTASHLLLFKLHIPSRYTEHSFRIIFSVTAGLVIVILIDAAFKFSQKSNFDSLLKKLIPLVTILVLGIPLLGYPLLQDGFPTTGYKKGNAPALYEFLKQQQHDIVVASLSLEGDYIPTFAQRSILVSPEYAIPYHWGYYQQFRQRTLDLITAQYSSDFDVVSQFIDQYQIKFWLLDRSSFTPEYLSNNNWLQQYQPATKNAQLKLEQGIVPLLETRRENCAVFENDKLVLLSSSCIISAN